MSKNIRNILFYVGNLKTNSMKLSSLLSLVVAIILIIIVLVGCVFAIVYYIKEYIIKWRPWGNFADLNDQIKYWSNRFRECLQGFEHLQELFEDSDKTRLESFMRNVCGLEYSTKDITSEIKELDSIFEETIENNMTLLKGLKTTYDEIHKKFENTPLERLTLKSKIIKKFDSLNMVDIGDDLFCYKMSDEPITNEAELFIRVFLMDFIIDFQKTLCKYDTTRFFAFYHDENTNFNMKQALRDIERQKSKKDTKISRNKVDQENDIAAFFAGAFTGMIPGMERTKVSIEKNYESQTLSHYKEPTNESKLINNVKIEYLSKLYKDNLVNLLGEDRSTDMIGNMKTDLTKSIFRRILIEIAKVDQNINYKILTDFLKLGTDDIKDNAQLQTLIQFYKREQAKLDSDHCLEDKKNDATEYQTEDELIEALDLTLYEFRIEKNEEDKNYKIFKDLKSQVKEYEIMLTSLESEFGAGLMMVHYDEMMQLFHTLILLEEYRANKESIDVIIDYAEEDKNKYFEIIRSLQELNILISHDFMYLQYYDMCRASNLERKMIYYLDIFDRYGDYVATLAEIQLYSYEYFDYRIKSTRHKKLRSSMINSFVDWVYSIRKSMHNIAKKPGIFILNNFEWAMEGFTDEYEQFSNDENYKNKKGDVIEPFTKSISRFFKGILDFIKTLLKMVKIITDPIKIIKILIVSVYSIIVILMSYIELITCFFTGIFLIACLLVIIVNLSIPSLFFIAFIFVIAFQEIYLFGTLIGATTGSNKSYLGYWAYNLTAAENDIRNWHRTPGFDQGNKIDTTIIGHTTPCPRNYDKQIIYCIKNPNYLPTFSHQANIYKIATGDQPSGEMNYRQIQKTPDFLNKSTGRKKQAVRIANNNKRSHYTNNKYFFDKHDNIKNYLKTICLNPDQFDVGSDIDKLKQQCAQLFCKNGSYISSCVSVPPTDLSVSSILNSELKTIGRYMNIIFSIILVVIIIAFLTRKDMLQDASPLNISIPKLSQLSSIVPK